MSRDEESDMASHRSADYHAVVLPPHLRVPRRRGHDFGDVLPVVATISLLIVVLVMVYQLVG